MRLIKTENNKFLLAFQFAPLLPKNFLIAKEELKHNNSWQGIVMQSSSQKEQWGDLSCAIETLGIKARFSPFGFVQNHPEQSENLYRAIMDAIEPDTVKILDLYCGIGITSLLLAKAKKKGDRHRVPP